MKVNVITAYVSIVHSYVHYFKQGFPKLNQIIATLALFRKITLEMKCTELTGQKVYQKQNWFYFTLCVI